MGFILGSITEHSDVNTIRQPEIISAAKVIELPSNKGIFYQAMSAPRQALTSNKYEIYGRSCTGNTGKLGDGNGTGAAGWDNSATTGLKMNAAAMNLLTIGSVLQIEDTATEVVVVKAVDRSANTIDVFARGAGATTAAAHADEVPFSVIGFSGRDTDLKNVESRHESTSKYINYTQQFFEILDYKKNETLIGRQGLSPERLIAIEQQEAMLRIAKMLSSSSIQGYKQVGSDNIPSMSAGLISQLRDTSSGTREIKNVTSVGKLDETKLKNALTEAFETGTPDTIWANPSYATIIDGFIPDDSRRYVPSDNVAGLYVSKYNYRGKILEVAYDVDIPVSTIPIVTMSKCQKGFLQGDDIRMVDEPGLSNSREIKASIQGAVGFMVEGVGYDHILMEGVTTT